MCACVVRSAYGFGGQAVEVLLALCDLEGALLLLRLAGGDLVRHPLPLNVTEHRVVVLDE